MRSKQVLRSNTQQKPPYITSGKEQLTQLINTLRQSGIPEQELKGLFQELRHEAYRDERDEPNNSPDN